MTDKRYAEIRQNANFMYLYYRENGGRLNNIREFNTLFGAWLNVTGQSDYMDKLKKIVKSLDEKHNF